MAEACPVKARSLIDGVPTNGAYLNVVTVIPTQDAIQEFKVQTNNLGPEYGRFAGGVINLTTKSGTNQFHGSVYEFIRNKVLNANDFFDNRNGVARPPFTQNQFGGNVGGPVLKDKLFFFGSYEGFRLRKGSPFQACVPTAAERSGDFSAVGSSQHCFGIQHLRSNDERRGREPGLQRNQSRLQNALPEQRHSREPARPHRGSAFEVLFRSLT